MIVKSRYRFRGRRDRGNSFEMTGDKGDSTEVGCTDSKERIDILRAIPLTSTLSRGFRLLLQIALIHLQSPFHPRPTSRFITFASVRAARIETTRAKYSHTFREKVYPSALKSFASRSIQSEKQQPWQVYPSEGNHPTQCHPLSYDRFSHFSFLNSSRRRWIKCWSLKESNARVSFMLMYTINKIAARLLYSSLSIFRDSKQNA